MSAEDQQAVVDLIAANPEAGKIMPGCGGARKLRVARPGGGKSERYRVITYYAGTDMPTLFSKNEKTNLTKGERNALATLIRTLTKSLRRKT